MAASPGQLVMPLEEEVDLVVTMLVQDSMLVMVEGRSQSPTLAAAQSLTLGAGAMWAGQVSMSTALICPQFHPDVSRVHGVPFTNAIYVCGWLVSKEDLNKVKLHSTAIPPNPTPKTQSKTYSKTHSKAYNTTS